MEEARTLYLSIMWIVIIFVYYFFVFAAGIYTALMALLPEHFLTGNASTFTLAVIGAIGMSATGSAIYYLRKLYKSCFLATPDSSTENKLKRIGTVIYFLVRPVFSIGFSLLVIVSLRAGFTLASKKPIELNEGFIYVSMFLSFYVGFFSGRFINNLEESSDKMLRNVIGSSGK